ncbi:HET-domain-containing protein [Cubamyces sp. BRFM 1775]|nr:HET-domain-containing protein [Cubamyces sp. BRFM 1775]
MWLLQTSDATLHFFNAGKIPPYAILSHVWRGEEQSFQDVMALRAASRESTRGFPDGLSAKIKNFCEFAANAGYHWVWIDTCCIDKSSSAELSEALNSMFSWYANADMCYAFLDDVNVSAEDPRIPRSSFRQSQWFTRGWTLQELLAPYSVIFLSREWRSVGSNHALAGIVEEITTIDSTILTHEVSLSTVSVARRMSWASRRSTTRIEDEAYCLMGLFGVHMPTVYGEGQRAFARLQEEILRQLPDQSLFAWALLRGISHDAPVEPSSRLPLSAEAYRSQIAHPRYHHLQDLLAQSPKDFVESGDIRPIPFTELSEILGTRVPIPVYHTTGGGLSIKLPILAGEPERAVASSDNGETIATMVPAVLACKDEGGRLVVLYLRRESDDAFSIGFPTLRTYVRIALWEWQDRPRFTDLRDVYVAHRRQPVTTLPYFSLHQLSTDARMNNLDPVLTYFFFPVFVLARLGSAGFVPSRYTDAPWGHVQPIRTDDGISVDLRRYRAEDRSSNSATHILFWRTGVNGPVPPHVPIWMRILFGVGCGCHPKHSIEDIWVDVEVGNSVNPSHAFIATNLHFQQQQCRGVHLSRNLPELQFSRPPYTLRIRVAPWCGYPARSNVPPSCQYMVDVSIQDTMASGTSVAQSNAALPLVPLPLPSSQNSWSFTTPAQLPADHWVSPGAINALHFPPPLVWNQNGPPVIPAFRPPLRPELPPESALLFSSAPSSHQLQPSQTSFSRSSYWDRSPRMFLSSTFQRRPDFRLSPPIESPAETVLPPPPPPSSVPPLPPRQDPPQVLPRYTSLFHSSALQPPAREPSPPEMRARILGLPQTEHHDLIPSQSSDSFPRPPQARQSRSAIPPQGGSSRTHARFSNPPQVDVYDLPISRSSSQHTLSPRHPPSSQPTTPIPRHNTGRALLPSSTQETLLVTPRPSRRRAELDHSENAPGPIESSLVDMTSPRSISSSPADIYFSAPSSPDIDHSLPQPAPRSCTESPSASVRNVSITDTFPELENSSERLRDLNATGRRRHSL